MAALPQITSEGRTANAACGAVRHVRPLLHRHKRYKCALPPSETNQRAPVVVNSQVWINVQVSQVVGKATALPIQAQQAPRKASQIDEDSDRKSRMTLALLHLLLKHVVSISSSEMHTPRPAVEGALCSRPQSTRRSLTSKSGTSSSRNTSTFRHVVQPAAMAAYGLQSTPGLNALDCRAASQLYSKFQQLNVSSCLGHGVTMLMVCACAAIAIAALPASAATPSCRAHETPCEQFFAALKSSADCAGPPRCGLIAPAHSACSLDEIAVSPTIE